MSTVCGTCRHGHEQKPDGGRPPAGTVWCSRRKIQMAKNRVLDCYIPLVVQRSKRCVECKKAKITKPSGETPELGHVWCEKRHIEINKQRSMECFE